jgi:hypothetical protein
MEVGDLLGVDDLLDAAGSSLHALKSEIALLREATVRGGLAAPFRERPESRRAAGGARCRRSAAAVEPLLLPPRPPPRPPPPPRRP